MTDTSLNRDPSEAQGKSRRGWLLGAVAGVATLGGAGMALRIHAPLPSPVAPLWTQEFDLPQGGVIAMKALRGRPLVLNFWATWCPPCIAELPLLSSFYDKNVGNGWQVLGLAVDRVASVQRFLERAPVSFPVAMAGSAGIEITRSLGNLVGGLPFTLVLNSDGDVAHRKMGQLSTEDLRLWVMNT